MPRLRLRTRSHRPQRGPRGSAFLALTLALFAAGPSGRAEPEAGSIPETSRPSLALVLGGGGARGAAHVGVIEVLEELRVPVDAITGTSMGAVVGGLYAAGLSPEELGEVVRDTDWVRIFNDEPDRQELSFRRKQDDRTYLTNLRLGFRDWQFYIPSGLVEGQKLDVLLRTLSLTSDGVARIESLPLPFRAVATDIATGDAVVFDEGELPLAQRASMSIPGVFSPVRMDGRLLVDGYVADNLPIAVALDMGAEHVIAVDVSTPISELDGLDSAVAISGQVSTLPVQLRQQEEIARLGEDDVVIRPDLEGVDAGSFTNMEKAIEAGRQAARAVAPQLARYAVSEEEYAAWRARQRRPREPAPVVDAIRIENSSDLSDRVIRARIETRPGEPLDVSRLADDITTLYGLDAFERVRFDLRREQEEMVLVYRLEPRERGKHYFRVGLNLESDIGDQSTYNIGLRHVWFPLDAWGGELRTEAQFGNDSGISSELYQPLDPAGWFFIQPEAYLQRDDLDIYIDGDRVARYARDEWAAGLQLGVNLGRSTQLRGGIGYLGLDAHRKIGLPELFPSFSLEGGFYGAVFEHDNVDDASFPNSGTYARAIAQFSRKELGFEESFSVLETRGAIYETFWDNTVGIGFKYNTELESGGGPASWSTLGGFFNLSGFEPDSLVGPYTGVAQLAVYRRIASPALFAWEFPVYAGGLFEAGNAWQHAGDIDEDVLLSGSAFFGVDTPLGPLYIAYAYGEGGEHQGYVYLGQTF